MRDEPVDVERLSRELDYYKRQLDEMAGERVDLDRALSGLRLDYRQKRRGFELLTELQRTISTGGDVPSIFEAVISAVNATLGMDKTVVLEPTGRAHHYRPTQWLGFHQSLAASLSKLSIEFPPEFADGSGLLLVNRSTASTPLAQRIRSSFELPYFVCLPVMLGDVPLALLLSGRAVESGPFNPSLDQGDVDTFRAITGLVSALLQTRRMAALEEAHRRERDLLERELQVAHDMQMDLLPKEVPQVDGLEISGICIPANHVGGDYYQYLALDDGRFALAVADVSGKAMDAAPIAMRFSDMLRYEVKGRTDVTEILKGLDESLKGNIPMTMFVTCGLAVWDPVTKRLTVGSAAVPEIYHWSAADRSVSTLGITGVPLGMPLPLTDPNAFGSAQVDVQLGDVLVFTSDGIEEAQDAIGEFYGGERLAEVIREAALNGAAIEIRDTVVEDVRRFIGDAAQGDDLTVVVVRRETQDAKSTFALSASTFAEASTYARGFGGRVGRQVGGQARDVKAPSPVPTPPAEPDSSGVVPRRAQGWSRGALPLH